MSGTLLSITDSYALSKVPGDASFETSVNGVPTYYFGKPIARNPVLDMNFEVSVAQAKKLGNWYPTNAAGSYPLDKIMASYIPVNGIMFFATLGKATHTVANTTQTITNMTTTEGRKPRYKLLEKIGTGIKHEAFGGLWHDLTLRYEGRELFATQMGKAQKHTNSSSVPSATTFPSDVSTPFLNHSYFKWNSSAIDTLMCEFKIAQVVNAHEGSSGYYDEISESDAMIATWSLGFSGEQSTLFTDYMARTARQIDWKMTKRSITEYFTITCANSICTNIKYIKEKNEIAGGVATFLSENCSVVVKDDVADTFYTVPS